MSQYKIILSSNSPRRKELLAGLDLDFEVRVISGIDESYPADLAVDQVPEYLARKKAAAYDIADNELVITADTIVTIDNMILGKPKNDAEAHGMLKMLSGRTHRVITGVCLSAKDRQRHFSVTSEVTFKALTDQEIDYYIAKYHPLDKAGAYGIQEWIGYVGVTALNGSYFNVVGLPVQRIYEELTSEFLNR